MTFPVGQGVTKKCGDDFIKAEVSKTAKVRKLRIRNKGKGVGKKSNITQGAPGHNSAQVQEVDDTRDAAQDSDVLDVDISKSETEILYVENHNKSKAGPSGQRGEKEEERGRRKEKGKEREREKELDNSGEKPKTKSRNSPKQGWIKFFHDKGTPNAKNAEQENSAHQLLVHWLPGEFLEGTMGGLQERALNKLLINLGKEEIGDRGITLQQEQIIGAHPIKPSSSSDKSPITRLTVDSRETKEKIRKAAKITKRWGSAGGHTVFLRDIPPEKVAQKRKRTPSSNEDTKMPKKHKPEGKETQRSSRSKKEEGIPRRRILDERPETKWEERNRTAGAAQAKLDSEKAASEKLRLEQLEARRTKLAHQDWETQDLINKQGQRPQKPQTSGFRPTRYSRN